MSEVTGPISTLPGTRLKAPAGTMCDHHSDRRAVTRIQGETDSFGSELYDLCQECLDEMTYAESGGHCEWCLTEVKVLHPARDYEEGLHGRVYHVCAECIARQKQSLMDYLNHGGAE